MRLYAHEHVVEVRHEIVVLLQDEVSVAVEEVKQQFVIAQFLTHL